MAYSGNTIWDTVNIWYIALSHIFLVECITVFQVLLCKQMSHVGNVTEALCRIKLLMPDITQCLRDHKIDLRGEQVPIMTYAKITLTGLT